MPGTTESCTCQQCQDACKHKPGWFLPGEAEEVADHLGVPFDELFRTQLVVDVWEGDKSTYVLSPAVVGVNPGEVVGLADSIGQCVFYVGGQCGIHAVKPYECRDMLHDEPSDAHRIAGEAWEPDEHQQAIKELLDLTR